MPFNVVHRYMKARTRANEWSGISQEHGRNLLLAKSSVNNYY